MNLRQAHGRQARSLIEHPRHNLPQGQLAGETTAERLADAEVAGRLEADPYGADRLIQGPRSAAFRVHPLHVNAVPCAPQRDQKVPAGINVR